MNATDMLARQSFIELGARGRARALLDTASMRELIDPFARLQSRAASPPSPRARAATGARRAGSTPSRATVRLAGNRAI